MSKVSSSSPTAGMNDDDVRLDLRGSPSLFHDDKNKNKSPCSHFVSPLLDEE